MRGWIYLLDPGCCLPLAMPDRFRIATDPLCVVDALRSFSLPPCSSCARHTLRLRGLRATCHLTLRLPFRSLHRPMHPFLASRTCPCALSGIRFSCSSLAPASCRPSVLSALVSSLSCRPFPSPVLPALLFVCSSLCPPRFLSCPPSVRPLSTLPPPHLPSAFPTLLALYPSLIPT